ncbi:MAG: DUF1684 domain-containing protein [Saprospiraceae bacterium]|nr:DUF1684 domain-containing protein [Lewinella sp.]
MVQRRLGTPVCLLCSILLLSACKTDAPDRTAAYEGEIHAWRQKRLNELMAPDSWLGLAGLFWLEPGVNTFGSAAENTIVLPGAVPEHLGTFYLQGDTVLMELTPGNRVKVNGLEVDSYPLSGQEVAPVVAYKHLSWTLISRSNKFGIRLWDSERPELQDTVHIASFPLDPKWRVAAQWIPDSNGHTVTYRNVLDMVMNMETEGRLRFERNGQSYELTALDGGEEELFLIFADATTGETTYGGGRYLYTPRPDSTGTTYLDFNEAYNPPCAFTKFATCLLPPAENRLGLAITAGELSYGEH